MERLGGNDYARDEARLGHLYELGALDEEQEGP
jgi:hypothetical protein